MIIAAVILISVLIPFILGWIYSAPYYKGPSTDHFDGKKFHNPGGIEVKSFRDLVKWARNREKGPWREITSVPYDNAPPATVTGDSARVTFVNHSTFLVQTHGLNILTDPVWSERASPVSFAGPKRMRPPGILMEDLPRIDMILLSHNHYDHLDIKTLSKLYLKYHPVIYCSLGIGLYLKKKGIDNIIEMDWWDEVEISDFLKVVSTPAQHFSGRGMFDRNRTLWSGFALVSGKGSIYFAGDSGYGDFFREIGERIGPVRLALLPIGAFKPQWFMSSIHTSPEDAVRIHEEIGSQQSIGTHFGTFPLADDGMDDPVVELQKALKQREIPADRFQALKEGASLELHLVAESSPAMKESISTSR